MGIFFPEQNLLPDTIVVELLRAEITAPPQTTLQTAPEGTENGDADNPTATAQGKPAPVMTVQSASAAQIEKSPDTVEIKPPPPSDPEAKQEAGETAPVEEQLKFSPTAKTLAPDPTSELSREVTLSINEQDERYRGFLYQVRGAIDREWRWREALLAAGRPGNVVVRMTLKPGGDGAEVVVIEGSGSSILDKEAMVAVQRAPFPAFPRHWSIRRLNLVAQFEYRFGDEY